MATAARMAASTTQPRPRRARGSITPEEVVLGAMELCEMDGVDGLSMPRLAQHLGVGVTSIYWYFKSKEALVNALSEEAFRRFYSQMPPLAEGLWDDVLRRFFRNFRKILRENDVLCDLCIMRGPGHSDETSRLTWSRIEEILEALVAQGFSEDSATEAYFALSVYTRGSIIIERIVKLGGGKVRSAVERAALTSDLPVVGRTHARHNWLMVNDEAFEFGLENASRGLSQLRVMDTHHRSAAPASSIEPVANAGTSRARVKAELDS